MVALRQMVAACRASQHLCKWNGSCPFPGNFGCDLAAFSAAPVETGRRLARPTQPGRRDTAAYIKAKCLADRAKQELTVWRSPCAPSLLEPVALPPISAV